MLSRPATRYFAASHLFQSLVCVKGVRKGILVIFVPEQENLATRPKENAETRPKHRTEIDKMTVFLIHSNGMTIE